MCIGTLIQKEEGLSWLSQVKPLVLLKPTFLIWCWRVAEGRQTRTGMLRIDC